MALTAPKFGKVTEVAMPDLAVDETYSKEEQERTFGEMVLRNWIKVARWNWADQHVADMLEKEAFRLRENHHQ